MLRALQREMARIAEEDGLLELASAFKADTQPVMQDRRSKGWAESRYRTPKKETCN